MEKIVESLARALVKTLKERQEEEEREALEKRTISVAGKTFTLEALVESLSDPAAAAQIGLNTLGNLATLASEIAIIQKEGVKDHELSLIGTIVGFVGWALILACRAEEHND